MTYSNAPLLRKMKVYIVDENPLAEVKKTKKFKDEHAAAQSPFGTFPISDDGAQLMPYEKLISPDVVKHNPLHFPWGRVQQELDKLAALGKSYLGRRLYLLYNPTEKHQRHDQFCGHHYRPKMCGPATSHMGAAINYYLRAKVSASWKASYPGGQGSDVLRRAGRCNHASLEEDVYRLTIRTPTEHLDGLFIV